VRTIAPAPTLRRATRPTAEDRHSSPRPVIQVMATSSPAPHSC
jgi:hypothetical protein